jgi:hypothetical protein
MSADWVGKTVSFHEIAVGGPHPDEPDRPFYRLWSARSESGVFRFTEYDKPACSTFRVVLNDFKGAVPADEVCKMLVDQALRPRYEYWNARWDRPDLNPVSFVFSGQLLEQENFDDGAWRAPTMELTLNAQD